MAIAIPDIGSNLRQDLPPLVPVFLIVFVLIILANTYSAILRQRWDG